MFKIRQLILASQSPRRAEILKKAGIIFVSFPVSVSEIPNENLSLDEQIIDIATRKAKACVEQHPDLRQAGLVLASDTMVCLNDKAIGKPENEADAFHILKRLSGQRHDVKTAVVIFDSVENKWLSHIETTHVYFKHLSDSEIHSYIQTKEPMDKAGAYGIQGLGGVFVDRIEGDFNNVVGLPITAVENILQKENYQIERHSGIYKNLLNELNHLQNLLAVSKLQPIEKIETLYRLGQSDFGENYIQEALEKIDLLKNHKIRWHLIGPVQKNKVKFLKNNFYLIHSVDSIELAELISKKAIDINHKQKVLIQINLADESTKSGFTVNDFHQAWPRLKTLTGLEVIGLMTMPPLQNEAEQNRPYFQQLKNLAHTYSLSQLSMGTSHDYKVALEEGATWIRIGTVLFGERTKMK